MKKIKSGFILPSGILTIDRKDIEYYSEDIDKKPKVGDLVYGSISYLGFHKTLESQHGRIHSIDDGTKAIFVYGNRYAPDAYEATIPDCFSGKADLIARSGLISKLESKNSNVADCTKVKVLGYVCQENGEVINTRDNSKLQIEKINNRAKLILVIGSSMNSGKSHAAALCCWALSNKGYNIKASKVTGTASLKDILLMEDSGATEVSDFSYLGYPSTYLLEKEDLMNIYCNLDDVSSNCDYWVVEFADGILQRETAMLLENKDIQKRIHKLVFCSRDALGIIGGVNILKDKFNLTPDILSGLFSSSPLAIKESKEYINLPIMDSSCKGPNESFKYLL